MQEFSLSFVNQVARDWQKESFSSLLVTREAQCPDSHPMIAMSRPWFGTDIGCDCLGIVNESKLLDNSNKILVGESCSTINLSYGCKTVEASPPVLMA